MITDTEEIMNIVMFSLNAKYLIRLGFVNKNSAHRVKALLWDPHHKLFETLISANKVHMALCDTQALSGCKLIERKFKVGPCCDLFPSCEHAKAACELNYILDPMKKTLPCIGRVCLSDPCHNPRHCLRTNALDYVAFEMTEDHHFDKNGPLSDGRRGTLTRQLKIDNLFTKNLTLEAKVLVWRVDFSMWLNATNPSSTCYRRVFFMVSSGLRGTDPVCNFRAHYNWGKDADWQDKTFEDIQKMICEFTHMPWTFE